MKCPVCNKEYKIYSGKTVYDLMCYAKNCYSIFHNRKDKNIFIVCNNTTGFREIFGSLLQALRFIEKCKKMKAFE